MAIVTPSSSNGSNGEGNEDIFDFHRGTRGESEETGENEHDNHREEADENENEEIPPLQTFPPLPTCVLTSDPSIAAAENGKVIPQGYLIHQLHDWVSMGVFGVDFFEHGGIVIKPKSAMIRALSKSVGEGRVVPVRFGNTYEKFISKFTSRGFHKYDERVETDSDVYYNRNFLPQKKELCGVISVQTFAKGRNVDTTAITQGMGALRRAPLGKSIVLNPRSRMSFSLNQPSPSPSPSTLVVSPPQNSPQPTTLNGLFNSLKASLDKSKVQYNLVDLKIQKTSNEVAKAEVELGKAKSTLELLKRDEQVLGSQIKKSSKLLQLIQDNDAVKRFMAEDELA